MTRVNDYHITEEESYGLALDLLKSLDCPKAILEAIDIWWMIRGHEVTKLRNWTAVANGQGVVDAEMTIKALPEGEK